MTSAHIGRPLCHCWRHVGTAVVTAAMAAALLPSLPPSSLLLPLPWLLPSPSPPAPFLLLLLPLFGVLLSCCLCCCRTPTDVRVSGFPPHIRGAWRGVFDPPDRFWIFGLHAPPLTNFVAPRILSKTFMVSIIKSRKGAGGKAGGRRGVHYLGLGQRQRPPRSPNQGPTSLSWSVSVISAEKLPYKQQSTEG